MARNGTGLTIGQVITLTIGYIVASIFIFLFGWWVGYDVAEQRLARDQQALVVPVPPSPTPPFTQTPSPTNTFTAAPPTPTPTLTPPPPTTTHTKKPTATGTRTPAGTRTFTSTRRPTNTPRPIATVEVTPMEPVEAQLPPAALTATDEPLTPTPRATAAPAEPESAPDEESVPAPEEGKEEQPEEDVVPTATAEREAVRVWTVQATATTDPVKAVVLARTLREKGYDAFTATREIKGTIWYQVRVGRFRSRDEAEAIRKKLEELEGLDAAFVAEQ